MLSTTKLVAMLCCTLSTTVVNNHCLQLFTFNNHCSIIVDNHQQAFFINYCQLMFQQHCNNYCSLSTSNNYWSNNTRHHCEFNKCCWTLITILFRRCSANNVASTWSIFPRVTLTIFVNFDLSDPMERRIWSKSTFLCVTNWIQIQFFGQDNNWSDSIHKQSSHCTCNFGSSFISNSRGQLCFLVFKCLLVWLGSSIYLWTSRGNLF